MDTAQQDQPLAAMEAGRPDVTPPVDLTQNVFRSPRERAIEYALGLCALVSVFTTVGIVAVLLYESASFFAQVSFSQFFGDTQWTPQFVDKHFGIWPLLLSTLIISLIAMVVSIPLGGPPYFFVLGLAGGFGYNRDLIAPTIDEVDSFPLVAVATGGSAITKPITMLGELENSVPPTIGAYWLAAGLRFNSFGLVNSFAMLYVLLNRGLEIGLLGIASMQLPPGSPLVSIEMALKVRFSTADGVFSVEAQLTDNSWLLDESCRLTGGLRVTTVSRQP